jgi:hypothetical protein
VILWTRRSKPFSPNGIWHFSFHADRDLSEKLAEGKEVTYLNWCFDWTPNTIKVFSKHSSI